MIIANKQTLVQEDGGDFIAGKGVSQGLKSDRGVWVSKETEVSEKASRHRFTAEYKRDILKQTDTCTELGSLGALLRREGLYSSHGSHPSNITTWRRQRDRSILSGLTPKKRGRKESVRHPLSVEMTTLRQENDRLTKRLKRAEMIIHVQKKYQRYWGFIRLRPSRKEGPTHGSRHHAFNRYRDSIGLRVAFDSPLRETCKRQRIEKGQLTIHADRGSSMRSKPVALLLSDLGITKTHSRPYTSDDNPFSESQFKTLKYRPDFPNRFGCIEDSRRFAREFFSWYNTEHHHSGIGLLTPETVHYGLAEKTQMARGTILSAAYEAHPERFVRKRPAPPSVPTAVWINKPKEPPVSQEDRH